MNGPTNDQVRRWLGTKPQPRIDVHGLVIASCVVAAFFAGMVTA